MTTPEAEPATSRAVVERTIRSAVRAVYRYSSPQRVIHTPRFAQFLRRKSKLSTAEAVFLASSYSGRVLIADNEEIQRIIDEFARIPDKYGMFEKMFIQLFIEEDIQMAVHFGLENLETPELRKDQRFRTHVGKFQRFMNSLMDMLSKGNAENEHIVHMLRLIGRQHCNVRSMSFTAEKWLIFKNVLLSLLCQDSNTNYSTWSKLISFVIFEIKDSYLEHVRHVRSSSCPHIVDITLFKNGFTAERKHPSTTSESMSSYHLKPED